jgi:hypothetical protein
MGGGASGLPRGNSVLLKSEGSSGLGFSSEGDADESAESSNNRTLALAFDVDSSGSEVFTDNTELCWGEGTRMDSGIDSAARRVSSGMAGSFFDVMAVVVEGRLLSSSGVGSHLSVETLSTLGLLSRASLQLSGLLCIVSCKNLTAEEERKRWFEFVIFARRRFPELPLLPAFQCFFYVVTVMVQTAIVTRH